MSSKVAEKRRQLNITQSELATRVGISRAHLANIEAGRKSSGLKTAQRLAKELNTTVEELFGDDGLNDDKQ